MAEAIMFKFLAHPNLAAKLIATPDEELIEYNEWHDNFWGMCTCNVCANKTHQNKLGKLLTITREYLINLQQA
jgi:predicted NAD-dependent protein-ADP-ribosyltransferase YbiA (DUF1768 family)